MRIVISGTPASGKSSVAKLLAEKLGYKHYSTGDWQREMAQERKLSIVDWHRVEAKDQRFDNAIDERMAKLGKTEDDFVIDSWLGAHFIPDGIKVYVDADQRVRASRRLMHKRPEESYRSLEEVMAQMGERERLNKERWWRFYRFDYSDTKNYDLVIDSSTISIEQVVEAIIEYLKQKHLNTGQSSRDKAASRKVHGGSG